MPSLTPIEHSLLRKHKGALLHVFGLSGLVNVLMLTGAIYMLQVYDRVLASRSGSTLLYLTLIMIVVYVALHFFDEYRQKILSLVGRQIEEDFNRPVFKAALEMPLRRRDRDRFGNTIRDFEEVGRFLSSAAIVTLFDLPWMPIYVVVCFLFHPLIGAITLMSIIVVILLTMLGDKMSRAPAAELSAVSRQRQQATTTAQRQSEVIAAMGFSDRIMARFVTISDSYHAASSRVTDVLIGIGGWTRTIRLVIQSLLLGVAAWLVINDLATPGVMIASSIIAARALAPIDQLVGRWRNMLLARDSWLRVREALEFAPPELNQLELPRPANNLSCENLCVGPPGMSEPTVRGVTFRIEAGDALGIIGLSGSGKTTLLRGLLGIWQPKSGTVRLDDAPLDQFSPHQRSMFVGYMPQDVQLMRGTIAENIARFLPTIDPAAVIEAAMLAGAHQMILRLPEGYNTDVGDDGFRLSGGQRQRIGLARALFGHPFLVVLDEPNSNLDNEGEKALAEAIRHVRSRQGIVMLVAHRQSTLKDVNKLLLLSGGQQELFGDKNEVFAYLQAGGNRRQQSAIADAGRGSHVQRIEE
jgi:ATP-binding cassette subfamily C protein